MPRCRARLSRASAAASDFHGLTIQAYPCDLKLAAGWAEGALISQSLAVTVVGGLTTSTLLTLVVVPVIYDLLEGWKDRILSGERAERNEMAV